MLNINFNHTKPDEDGDINFGAELTVTNDTEDVIELLQCKAVLFDPDGYVIATNYPDDHECEVSPGDSYTWSNNYLLNTKESLLKGRVEESKLAVQVRASKLHFGKLPSIELSEEPLTVSGTTEEVTIGNVFKFKSGASWVTEPDDEGEIQLAIRTFCENISQNRLLVQLKGELVDSRGKCIEELQDDFSWGAGSGNITEMDLWSMQDKKINGAKAVLSATVFEPLKVFEAAAKSPKILETDY